MMKTTGINVGRISMLVAVAMLGTVGVGAAQAQDGSELSREDRKAIRVKAIPVTLLRFQSRSRNSHIESHSASENRKELKTS